MFSAVLIPVIGLILIGVLLLFSVLFRSGEATATDEVQEEPAVQDNRAVRNVVEPVVDHETHHRAHVHSYEPDSVARNDNGYYNNGHHDRERFQRPATPSHTNHYRPSTPIHQIRPITPNEQRARIASPTGVPTYRQSNAVPAQLKSSRDDDFRSYEELSDEERAEVANLGQCMIDIEQAVLDPFLERINATGDGRTARYVIGKFDKSADGQLTPSQKFIRKSFKIKNRGTNTCRFARFRIRDSGDGYYRLVFHDYTPYVEEHAPRFDVFNLERTRERSHWEKIRVTFHYNTEMVNLSQMLVLVPGGKSHS